MTENVSRLRQAGHGGSREVVQLTDPENFTIFFRGKQSSKLRTLAGSLLVGMIVLVLGRTMDHGGSVG